DIPISTSAVDSEVLLMNRRIKFVVDWKVLLAFCIFCLPVHAAEYSDLWGQNGEKWTPDSRLPEVSFAGYMCGEKPTPMPAMAANVKTFGAKGDGTTDDTKAFNDAIAGTNSGAILVPEGTYKITNLVTINKPNVVMRGEGPDKTIIYIPITLNDIRVNNEAS